MWYTYLYRYRLSCVTLIIAENMKRKVKNPVVSTKLLYSARLYHYTKSLHTKSLSAVQTFFVWSWKFPLPVSTETRHASKSSVGNGQVEEGKKVLKVCFLFFLALSVQIRHSCCKDTIHTSF